MIRGEEGRNYEKDCDYTYRFNSFINNSRSAGVCQRMGRAVPWKRSSRRTLVANRRCTEHPCSRHRHRSARCISVSRGRLSRNTDNGRTSSVCGAGSILRAGAILCAECCICCTEGVLRTEGILSRKRISDL